MANLAQEARDKAQANWPGATVNARGRNWIRQQHPTDPTRFVLDSHIGPIHYGALDDQEIDTAWQATGGGAWQYEMTTNNFQTYARDTFNAGDIFQFEKSGESLMFDPQSINWIDENTSRQQIAIKQAVTAVVNDNVLDFPAAYGSGRHFQYQNGPARLSKLITIDSASDLPAETLQGDTVWFEAEFSMSLSSGINFWIDGVEWARSNGVRVTTSDRIEVRNSAGDTVLWWLGFPRAWDSSADENATIGEMEVRRQGGPSSLFITIRIPKTWIDAATFPIYIDPTIDEQVGASGDDTSDHSGSQGFNTTDTTIKLGYETASTHLVGDMSARFTGISGLSGATIDTSYIQLRFSAGSGTALLKVSAEDAAAPAAPTTAGEFSGATLTTANFDWDDLADGPSGFVSSPSTNSIIQELADSYDPSVIQMFINDDGSSTGSDNQAVVRTEDRSTGVDAPKLHIEYTAAPAGGDVLNRGLSSIVAGVIASQGGGYSGLHPIDQGFVS